MSAVLDSGNTRSRAELIEEHLGLVVAVARRHSNRGVPLSDLVQEGTIGLMKAAERFDPTLGVRFASYASWWIKQAIWRAVGDFSNVLRIPPRIFAASHRVRSATHRLQNTLGREPLFDEIVATTQLSPAKVKKAIEVSTRPISLSDSLSADDGPSLIDLLHDPGPSPQSIAIEANLADLFQRALAQLPADQREVLRLRHGMGGTEANSIEKVAEKCGITADAVRNLETKGLRSLRKELHRLARDTFPPPARNFI